MERGHERALVGGREPGPDDAVALGVKAEAGQTAVEDRDRAEGAHVRERAAVGGELRQLTERGQEPAAELEADRERWLAVHVDGGEAGGVEGDDPDPVTRGHLRAVGGSGRAAAPAGPHPEAPPAPPPPPGRAPAPPAGPGAQPP